MGIIDEAIKSLGLGYEILWMKVLPVYRKIF